MTEFPARLPLSLAVALTAICAVGVSGCGTTHRAIEPPSTATATVVATAVPTRTAAQSPTASGAGGACTTGDLRLIASAQSSAGSSVFAVTATALAPCTLDRFFGAAGYHGTVVLFTSTARIGIGTVIPLAANQSVSFDIRTSYDTPTGTICPRVTSLRITPPNQRAYGSVAVTGLGLACARGAHITAPMRHSATAVALLVRRS
jgi:hypothetical protein